MNHCHSVLMCDGEHGSGSHLGAAGAGSELIGFGRIILFYTTDTNDHGLPFNPLKAIVAPRPIGWISSVNSQGDVNLAPYSFFNLLSVRPALIAFSSEGWKDTVAFIAQTKEFVCNIASYELRDQMNATSAPLERGQSEFEHAGIDMAPSSLVKPPRVLKAPASLECKLVEIQQLKTADGTLIDAWQVIGQIVGVHMADEVIVDGRFDITAARLIARCGYLDFVSTDTVFSIDRPAGGGNPTGG